MNKKFIGVFMIGAATLASLSTVTSCKDYDDDINDLQERLDGTGVDLKSEVTRLEGLLSSCKAACEKADTELNETIKNATNDAKGYADGLNSDMDTRVKAVEEAVTVGTF